MPAEFFFGGVFEAVNIVDGGWDFNRSFWPLSQFVVKDADPHKNLHSRIGTQRTQREADWLHDILPCRTIFASC
jgi:hypothetical protein